MDNTTMRKQLLRHEGLRLRPYKCPAGKLTIGVGRNLDDNGVSDQEAMIMLQNDIDRCIRDLKISFPRWDHFSDDRQHALIDMRFNLGASGFRGFKLMIGAIRAEDWTEAKFQALDSKWAQQVGGRAVYIAGLMKGRDHE